jgi:ankyrin repeat protein
VLYAVFTNHPEIAESLLATGIEPNIFEAAATGRVERVRELLKKDPTLIKAYSPDGWTALHLNWGNPQIAELLLDGGADINAVSKNRFIATPLQSALAAQWTAVARLLIARGANVNCRGDGGFSPLHEAASSGQLEIARLLLDHGAKIDAKTDDGKTPLDIAREFKQDEIVKLLRERTGNQ